MHQRQMFDEALFSMFPDSIMPFYWRIFFYICLKYKRLRIAVRSGLDLAFTCLNIESPPLLLSHIAEVLRHIYDSWADKSCSSHCPRISRSKSLDIYVREARFAKLSVTLIVDQTCTSIHQS